MKKKVMFLGRGVQYGEGAYLIFLYFLNKSFGIGHYTKMDTRDNIEWRLLRKSHVRLMIEYGIDYESVLLNI